MQKTEFQHGGLLLRIPGTEARLYSLVEEGEGPVFYYRPFDKRAPGMRSHLEERPYHLAAALKLDAFLTPAAATAGTAKAAYLEKVERARAWAAAHRGKVVLSRMQWHPEPIRNPTQVFESLCRQYPHATVHLFFHPAYGVWLGATPETLLKKQGNNLEAMSLAGTQQAGTHTMGAKEAEEQNLVTRQLVAHFKVLGAHDVQTTDVEIFRAGPVEHLLTWVSGQWSGPLEKALDLLHPTPAVCGYPGEEAMAFLKSEEGYDRAFYAGYFGVETKNSAQLFVNLRCARLHAAGVALFAGGGITAQSVAEDEWNETERKLKTLMGVLLND